ncbi:hypothetical protein GALMADRAFT_566656 [Galerina marginata CBS 339.88]|uniref:Uncharacterized protein n=1 Tax=Galerina marginata (strain CBS 339.88) TaxID=685588 RepID=A0A067T4Q1_GALM3|nr:hypothetical protein GALMADRAFT_566656 [Galerina marginata CBS 339.88]
MKTMPTGVGCTVEFLPRCIFGVPYLRPPTALTISHLLDAECTHANVQRFQKIGLGFRARSLLPQCISRLQLVGVFSEIGGSVLLWLRRGPLVVPCFLSVGGNHPVFSLQSSPQAIQDEQNDGRAAPPKLQADSKVIQSYSKSSSAQKRQGQVILTCVKWWYVEPGESVLTERGHFLCQL